MDEHMASRDEEGSLQCPRCGHTYGAAAKFCDQCGAPRAVACAACGAANSGAARFCSNCGSALATKDAAPARAADSGAPAADRPRTTEVAPAAGGPVPARHAYTPAYLVERILTSRSALEGERKLVTVLFADIADSSALAQRVDPERLRQLIGEVL